MAQTEASLRLPRLRVARPAIAVAVLFAAALLPVAVERGMPDWFPTAAGDNACYTFSASERAFQSEMNQERSKAGKGSMKLDPELSKAAAVHTEEMVKINTLHHTSSTALKKRVTGWSSLGENVGVGGDVSSLHRAFMASPAHKANILFPSFNNVGVGVAEAGGRMWVTVIFESKANPGTTLAMPKC